MSDTLRARTIGRDRSLTGKERVHARRELARKQREAVEAFVKRTGARLVDEDEYVRNANEANRFRERVNTLHAFHDGSKPWR